MEKDHLEEGLKEADTALALNPYEPLGYWYKGYAYYQMKDFPSAEAELKRAMQLDPYNAELAKNYACTLHKMGRLDEAYKVVRDISVKVPENKAFQQLLKDIQQRNVNNLKF